MQKLLDRYNDKFSRNVIKYLLAAVLLAVPLYAKFPFIRVPGTFVSVRLEDFLLGFLSLAIAPVILMDLKRFFRKKLNRAILLYLLVGFVSVLSAVFVTYTAPIHIGFLHLIRRIEYFVPFFAGVIAIKKNKSDIEFYFKIILLVIVVAFVYGFGQKYFGWPIIVTQNVEYAKGVALRWIPGSHINSTFAGHYDLASFLVLTLPVVIPAIFLLKGMKTKVLLIISALAGVWLMANSVSRISIVAYLGSVSLALFLLKKYKAMILVIVVSIFVFATTSAVIVRYMRIFDVVKEKISAQTSEIFDLTVYAAEDDTDTTPMPQAAVVEDRSSSIRFNVEWPRALRAFTKNLLLGTGYSSITLATDNDYLRALGETGILGFVSFGLIFVAIANLLIKAFPFSKLKGLELLFVVGYFSALPGILLNAFFIDVFEASKFAILFWLITGLVVGLIYDSYSKD